jgi:hypothetical protein
MLRIPQLLKIFPVFIEPEKSLPYSNQIPPNEIDLDPAALNPQPYTRFH